MSVHGSCCHVDLCVSDSMCVLCTSETKNFQYLFLNSHSQQHTTVHIPYTQHTQHTHMIHFNASFTVLLLVVEIFIICALGPFLWPQSHVYDFNRDDYMFPAENPSEYSVTLPPFLWWILKYFRA